MVFSCLSGTARLCAALTRQARPPGQARGRDQLTPFARAAAGVKLTHR